MLFYGPYWACGPRVSQPAQCGSAQNFCPKPAYIRRCQSLPININSHTATGNRRLVLLSQSLPTDINSPTATEMGYLKAAIRVLLILSVLASSSSKRTEGAEAKGRGLRCFGNCSDIIKCSKICKKNGFYSETAKIMPIASGGSKCCCVILAEENFQGLLEALSAPVMPASPGMWTPPPQKCVKLNFAVSLGTVDSVVAVIARNSSSMPVLIFAKVVQTVEPVVAMAHALKSAITLARNHSYQCPIFEGEAFPVFKNVCIHEADCRRAAHLILEDFATKLPPFNFWLVSLIAKQINYAAHNAAEWCRNASVFDLVKLDVIPASAISDVSLP